MLKLFDVWEVVHKFYLKWNVYNRVYLSPEWPLILHDREPLFKTTGIALCQYLAHGSILDVGTGTGRLPLLLAEMAPNITCFGVDVEPVLIHDAQQGANRKGRNNRIAFLLADAHALPFADRSFDVVISMMSLYQWHDRQKGVEEVHRVLKDEGFAQILVGRRYIYPGKVDTVT